MGVLDAPVVPKDKKGRRLDSFEVGEHEAIKPPYNLIEKLRRGRESAVLGLVGDSTGNGDDEWFRLICNRLSASYPKYKVRYFLWDDVPQTLGTGSYLTPVIVSSGINAPTITDNFSRADGIPGNTSTGEPYQAVSNMAISGNKLIPTSTSGSSVAVDPGQLDYTVSVDISVATSANAIHRVYARQSDDGNNSVFAEIGTATGVTTFYLYKKVNGATTSLGNAAVAAVTGGATVTLNLTVTDTAVSATVATSTLNATLSQADRDIMGDNTKVSLFVGASITGAAFDNLSITRPALTLDCYNASVAGQICDYGTARINVLFPVPVDLAFVNYGHNEPGQDCRPQYLRLARSILDRNPRIQLVAVSQNARASDAPLYKDGLLRNSSILKLASREGWGYVDVTSKFLSNPNYATDWLNPDQLHPNPSGSIAWADEVEEHLKQKPSVAAPIGASRVDAVRFFGPANFVAVESTPTLGMVSNKALSWSFDPTTQQAIMGNIHFPASWKMVNIHLLMVIPNATGLNAGTNGIAWEVSYVELGDPTGTTQGNLIVNSSGAVAGIAGTSALTAVSFNFGLNNAATDGQFVAKAVTSARITGRPVSIRIRRKAADAVDTFASAAYLTGVMIERAS